MSNYNLIAFGTFGNPNGFKQTFFIDDQNPSDLNLSKSINTFDLNTNAIKLFPSATIYSIRKESTNGLNLLSYSSYSFAKEQNSERSGTFIGSSILFKNKISDENIIVSILNEFQEQLLNKNVRNDVIMVNHSDSLTVSKPRDLDKVEYNLREITGINFNKFSNRNLVVYSNTAPSKLSSLFLKSMDLLNVYDTIFFTQSHEVAEFVGQKGIFKLAQLNDFENEINNFFEERRKKTETSINEFERELQKLDEDKLKMLQDYNAQIEQNELMHKENERRITQSKLDLDVIKKIYSDFDSKIRDLANQLKSGKKYDDVRLLYNENKRIFLESLEQLRRPNFINNIHKIKARTEIRNSPNINNNNNLQGGSRHEEHRQERRGKSRQEIRYDEPELNYYKLATFVLVAALFFAFIAYLFIGDNDETFTRENSYTESKIEQSQNNEPALDNKMGGSNAVPAKSDDKKSENNSKASSDNLNPKPNCELSQSDILTVNKNLKPLLSIDDVVNIIFKFNPTDVKKTYLGQENIYGKALIELNKGCFQEKQGEFYFVKDALKHLPCYKISK